MTPPNPDLNKPLLAFKRPPGKKAAALGPRKRKLWLSGAWGALLTVVAGIGLLLTGMGDGLTHLSYDLPFVFRTITHPQDVILVYLDENSHKILDQPFNAPWDRSLHAKLLERLKTDRAKAVVLDIVFSDPGPDPAADESLKRAIQAHGGVVLSGDYVFTKNAGGIPIRTLLQPLESFRRVAAGWGVSQLPTDSDFVIRQHFPTPEDLEGLSWAAAKLMAAEATESKAGAFRERWLNYYGPPGTLRSISYHQALFEDGVAPGFFLDKVVFVGQRLSTGFSGELKDEFGTVYTRWSKSFAPGVEIHATAFLNLLRNDWLVRFPTALEIAAMILLGSGAGYGLTYLGPKKATGIALLGTMLVVGLAWILHRYQLIWFAWFIAVVQICVALGWSVLFNSVRLYVDKRVLEQSLDYHLSPSRVQQLLKNPELLAPGGKEQQISVLFSDIADFSKIAQTLDPEDLFDLLNDYYDAALKSVHAYDGTVVQLIGDAILAVWNAPVAQDDHQARACLAAVELNQQLITFDASEAKLPMRTRVGIHTGMATVGNLGSKRRFNFSTIGESVNLASRLEGLNKHLGTELLATRAIQKSVDAQLLSRSVGFFKFKGFGQAVEVYELLDQMDPQRVETTRSWREAFAEGLKHFHRKQFGVAEQKFLLAIQLRKEADQNSPSDGTAPNEDGPSQFYLDQIEEFKKEPPGEHWHGEIELKEK